MEKTIKDTLVEHLENLDKKDLKRFRNKLVDEGKLGKAPGITKRKVEDAEDESDLADVLLKAFEDDAVNKTEDIMRFIGSNDTATKLRAEYSKSIVDQLSSSIEVYNMNSKPRGTCVIFNNVNFTDGKKRSGSDQDADALENTFKWLGFEVKVLPDRGVQDMKDKLEELSKKVTDADCCFICCVLSHGNATGVQGCDNAVLPIRDILSPFSGIRCPALAGKPKVFFIQACRGSEMQKKVNIQADSLGEKEVEFESDFSLDSIISIPEFADFLISMSTFEGCFALRNPERGSWFIQSLCDHLTKLCLQGEDILSILTKVNSDVGAMGTMRAKQIPEPRFTLRKKLIFHVPE
ncbi:caspase-8-like isoform X9 [Alosa sapidissima]|uniref:caspase-8-like isoform X9 n=1 Tax=Alosa sapidissima TaxID=34773 RepID=UPI001C0886B3|nr:caspase-8-like isoform X9 [Alosa sapidissima]